MKWLKSSSKIRKRSMNGKNKNRLQKIDKISQGNSKTSLKQTNKNQQVYKIDKDLKRSIEIKNPIIHYN
jgi:hypothetical protein